MQPVQSQNNLEMLEVVSSKEGLLRLGSKLEKFHETEDGGVGCCPVHDDTTPSLKLTWKDNKVLAHCYAGCEFRQLNSAFNRLGFKVSNLDAQSRLKNQSPSKKPHQLKRLVKENTQPDALPITFFDSVKHTNPKDQTLKLEAIAEGLKDPLIVESKKERKSCLSATIYKPGATRSNKGVDYVTAAIIDFDNKDKNPDHIEDILFRKERGGIGNYCHIWYTSYSHDPDVPRWRLIFPLAKFIPAEMWSSYVDRLIYALGDDPSIDEVIKKPAQIYYNSYVEKGKESTYKTGSFLKGELLDLTTLPLRPQGNTIETKEETTSLSAFVATEHCFTHGSDVEIAKMLGIDLQSQYGTIVFDEGFFWRYVSTHWQALTEAELNLTIQQYDGMYILGGNKIKLGHNKITSIRHCLEDQLRHKNFFAAAPVGINCQNGFITFENKVPKLTPHQQDYRQRHVLNGQWSPDCRVQLEGTLLGTLLHGAFKDEEDSLEKITLIQEIAGAVVMGHGTKLTSPKAIIFKGERAENGKSQVLQLLRSLLPKEAVCTITAAKMSDEKYAVGLVGKLLNTSDELSAAEAIASERFKNIITGEELSARDVYKSKVDFSPKAQHVFATNVMPAFTGGIDRGVQRRLIVLPFNRVIPKEERIAKLGHRIAEEEADLLLAFAVDGAKRLLKNNNFTEINSCTNALQEWINTADPVIGWVQTNVSFNTHQPDGMIRTAEAYECFKYWAKKEGYNEYRLPAVNGFVQRVNSIVEDRIFYKRTNKFSVFVGMKIDQTDSLASQNFQRVADQWH